MILYDVHWHVFLWIMPCQKPNGNIHRLNELLFCGHHIPLVIKMIQCISALLCCQFQYHNAWISVTSVVKFEGDEVTSDTVQYFLFEFGMIPHKYLLRFFDCLAVSASKSKWKFGHWSKLSCTRYAFRVAKYHKKSFQHLIILFMSTWWGDSKNMQKIES